MLWKFRAHVVLKLHLSIIITLLLSSSDAFSQDFTDASGEVMVRIYTGPWEEGWDLVSNHLRTSVSVDSDFVLVGGGAEIDPIDNPPGALLTASYPDANLTTWHAESKDHQKRSRHKLRAYAIGLRLAGISSVELRNHMVLVWQNSGSARNHPNAVAALPPGYLLVGGGARANYSGAGQLLTKSYPNAFQWMACSKDHNVSDPGSVDAFAIGITSGSIPGFGSLSISHNSVSHCINTGYDSSSVQTPTGWVLSSVGGQAQADNPLKGRLLTQVYPYPLNSKPGGKATSKDHFLVSSGCTYAHALSIRKQ